MTIQSDAKAILNFAYEEYLENRRINPEKLIQKFPSWDGHRIDRAIKYLRDIGAIDIILMLGSNKGIQVFILRRITPIGIQMVEDD